MCAIFNARNINVLTRRCFNAKYTVRTLKPLLDVNLYHDSHYNRAVSPKLTVHRARVCACEMAYIRCNLKSKTDRTDSAGIANRKLISKRVEHEWKQIGGLVYSVQQTGYSAGRNSVMACNENSSICVHTCRAVRCMYNIRYVFGRGTTIAQSAIVR